MSKQTVVETADSPRTALAHAIEARDAAAKWVHDLNTAKTRIEDERFEARRQLDAAREAGEVDGNDDVIQRLLAGETETALLTRTDRKAEAAAEKKIEACRAALALLGPEIAEAERSVEFKAMRVRDAAGDVIAGEVLDRQISEVERLRVEHERASAVLRFLNMVAPRSYTDRIAAALASSDARGEHASIAPWRAALVALMADASTELPR